MTIPTFFVQWVDPNDTTLGMDFFPPKGSDELHEALKQYYPHLNNLQARMTQASIDFLLENGPAAAHVSPASEKPTPNYLPSPSSIPSSTVASPSDASLQSAQNSTTLLKQEDLMNVWTLPSNPEARIHKRRTMTAEEKRAYKQKRLEGACADCKRRRRKCQHGSSTSPAASSSSSSKNARKNGKSKSSLDVPSPSAIFNAVSMEQCLLPDPQPVHDSVAFNLFTDVPADLSLADGVSMPSFDFPSSLDTDFLDLTHDWDLFPDVQQDRYAPLQSPHVTDARHCSADANTIRNSNTYSSGQGQAPLWSSSLDYRSMSPQDFGLNAAATASMSPDRHRHAQQPITVAGFYPTVASSSGNDVFYGLDSLMEMSPSSSSQDSFSDTGHVPGGSYISPLTPSTPASDALADLCGATEDFSADPFTSRRVHQKRKRDRQRQVASSPWDNSPFSDSLFVSDSFSPEISIPFPSQREPNLGDPDTGSMSRQLRREQPSMQQNAVSAFSLTQILPDQDHVMGISRNKKPEQVDSRGGASHDSRQHHTSRIQPGHVEQQDRTKEKSTLSPWRIVRYDRPSGSSSSASASASQGVGGVDHTLFKPGHRSIREPSSVLSSPVVSTTGTSKLDAQVTASPSPSVSKFATAAYPQGAVGDLESVKWPDNRLRHHSSTGSRVLDSRQRQDQVSSSAYSVVLARGAHKHHRATRAVVSFPGTASVSARAVGGADHWPIIGHRHESSGDSNLPSMASQGSSIGWGGALSSPLGKQHEQVGFGVLQTCFGALYFHAILRSSLRGTKMTGMLLGALHVAAIILLLWHGFGLR